MTTVSRLFSSPEPLLRSSGSYREIRRVVGTALIPTAMGVALGWGIALFATRVLEGALYELPATDPIAYAWAGTVVLLVGFVSSWIPARRAAHLEGWEGAASGGWGAGKDRGSKAATGPWVAGGV